MTIFMILGLANILEEVARPIGINTGKRSSLITIPFPRMPVLRNSGIGSTVLSKLKRKLSLKVEISRIGQNADDQSL